MRRASLICAALLFACGEPSTEPPPGAFDFAPQFLADAGFRRAALEQSLVDPTNGYARLRLDNYATPGGWDTLPVRNFQVRPVVEADLGAFATAPYRPTHGPFRRVLDGEASLDEAALTELGRRAFHEYPLELSNRFQAALTDAATAAELGLWTHDGRVGGLVRARLDDGTETFAATCATCHASVVDGALVDGRANAALDNSAIERRLAGGTGTDWGPGIADVTADGADNPVAITDLRPIRHQPRLHWAATLYNSPEALAVRVETLMITSAAEAMRPPRELAVAIAAYLWSLGPEPSTPSGDGARVFDRECAGCHGTLDAVPLAMAGTDPAVGASSERGTGSYRVPSLVGVGSRSQLLHTGSVRTLDDLLAPARLETTPGHEFGTALDPDETAALLDYLHEL